MRDVTQEHEREEKLRQVCRFVVVGVAVLLSPLSLSVAAPAPGRSFASVVCNSLLLPIEKCWFRKQSPWRLALSALPAVMISSQHRFRKQWT